jgi:hypothetical protein
VAAGCCQIGDLVDESLPLLDLTPRRDRPLTNRYPAVPAQGRTFAGAGLATMISLSTSWASSGPEIETPQLVASPTPTPLFPFPRSRCCHARPGIDDVQDRGFQLNRRANAVGHSTTRYVSCAAPSCSSLLPRCIEIRSASKICSGPLVYARSRSCQPYSCSYSLFTPSASAATTVP